MNDKAPEITNEDIANFMINDEVSTENIEYRLDIIEQILGIEELYIEDGSQVKVTIQDRKRELGQL